MWGKIVGYIARHKVSITLYAGSALLATVGNVVMNEEDKIAKSMLLLDE